MAKGKKERRGNKMVSLDELIVTWKEAGLYSVLLPFLIVFAISFAVIEKSGILGKKKQINVIVSAALGLFVVSNVRVIEIITRFLPNIALFMIVILMFLLLIGTMIGGRIEYRGWVIYLAVFVSIVFVIWALAADFIGTEWNLPSFWYGFDPATKTTIFFVAAIVVVIALFMGNSKTTLKSLKKGGIKRVEEPDDD